MTSKSPSKSPPPPSPPPPPAPEEAPEVEPEELPDGVYRKELTTEQLCGFYQAACVSREEMMKFLAEVLGLRDISHVARNAIIVDYFSWFLLYAKEVELNLETTFHLWKLSHDMLDCILGGANFQEAQCYFKRLAMNMVVCQAEGGPKLTLAEWKKIKPFFITTVFQHYTLLSYTFLHDHEFGSKVEPLWVQTPLLYPHKLSGTRSEIDEEEAAREAYEIDLAVYQFVEQVMSTAVAGIVETPEIDLDDLTPGEYVKAVPENIDQAIERACRHRIDEATKLFQGDYQGREFEILKKLIALEVKCGLEASVRQLPGAGPPPAR